MRALLTPRRLTVAVLTAIASVVLVALPTVQPVLQVAAVLLLSWALAQRLRTADRCPTPLTPSTPTPEP